MGQVKIRGTAADAAAKLVRVVQGRQQDYEAGVKNPRNDWATSTAGADATWAAGTAEAAARGGFKKGVLAAGTDRWQQGAVNKGAARWVPGVRDAQQRYQDKMDKNFAVLASVNLPPKRPRGDPGNIDRVRAVNDALAGMRRKPA